MQCSIIQEPTDPGDSKELMSAELKHFATWEGFRSLLRTASSLCRWMPMNVPIASLRAAIRRRLETTLVVGICSPSDACASSIPSCVNAAWSS